ncbi:MFS transporter [Candidatus Poriferisodalis sp.]|uniref:MFS transporter n=1 Tax=Candidatus Poriferisodalis sp. TaxID=3101277 RepID=UPI003B017C81
MSRHRIGQDRTATFAALGVPAFRALWLSGVFSFMSVQMQFLLRGWLAWELTQSTSALGVVMFSFGVSLLIATLFGGVAADRLPKRPLMLAGQTVLLLTAVGMGTALATEVIAFWMLALSSALQGLMFGLIGPARISMTSDLVGRDRMGNAITLSSLSLSGSRVIAPSVAGLLAGWAIVGLAGAYFVASVLAALSLVLLLPLPRATGGGSFASAVGRNPLEEIRQGIRYAMTHRRLRRTILISLFVMMFGFNYVAFMPALVEGEFGLGVTYVGLISSVSAVGAVVAAMLLASRADGPHAASLLVAFGFGFGATVAVLGLMPSFWFAALVSLGIGAASTGFMSLSQTLAMRASDNEYQGRVQSLVQLPFAGFAIMALPLGGLAEAINVRAALAVMGILVVTAMTAHVATAWRSGRRTA